MTIGHTQKGQKVNKKHNNEWVTEWFGCGYPMIASLCDKAHIVSQEIIVL